MPITITVPPIQTNIGPGLFINLQTTVQPPYTGDTRWQITIGRDDGEQQLIFVYTRPCTQPTTQLAIQSDDAWSETLGPFGVQQGNSVFVTARLQTDTGVLDTGQVSFPWNTTQGLGYQIRARTAQGGTGTGGFTEQDRLQLQAIETRTQTIGEPEQLVVQTPSGLQTRTIGQMLSRPLLDLLTLHEATSGPTGDPVRFKIEEYYFGVIVRVTTIADDLVAKTPDLEWYFPDLAVLRVFRGADLQFRRGIHTPTFMTEHPWEWGLPILNQTDILGIPADITIAVDWRVGCAGQVFLQRFP